MRLGIEATRDSPSSCPGRVQRGRLRERSEIRDPAQEARSATLVGQRSVVSPLGPGSRAQEARSAGTRESGLAAGTGRVQHEPTQQKKAREDVMPNDNDG